MTSAEHLRLGRPYHRAVSYTPGFVRAGIGLAVLAAVAWLGGCSDSPSGVPCCDPLDTTSVVADLILSDPVPASAAIARSGGAVLLPRSTRAEDSAVYVSLAPGTAAAGSRAILRLVGQTATLTAPVFDGGFDPVPLEAQEDDSVEVIVTNSVGATIFAAHAAVRPARPPIVVRTDPPRRKTDVPLNTAIVLVFSEPVAGSTLTASSVRLFRGAAAVAGSVRLLQGTSTTAVFQPDVALDPNADYRVEITRGVRDLGGAPLAASATTEFTTGASVVGPVAFVQIPGADSLAVPVGLQIQLTAVAYDAQNQVVSGRPAIWTSEDPSVVTVSATGLVTAVAEGYTSIATEVDGQVGRAQLLVSAALAPIASVTVTPDSSRVALGGTQQLVVLMRDTAGQFPQLPRPAVWTSSNTAVATVAANTARTALVTGVSAGIASIVVTSEGRSDTAVVAVGAPDQVIGLELSPDSPTVVLQATVQLSAFRRDDQGFLDSVDRAEVVWASSDSSIATVTSAGVMTGLRAGAATITGTWSGHQGSAGVTVASLSFSAISAGGSQTCGLTVNGRAFCWGYGADGQLGTGTTETGFPQAVASRHSFAAIAVTWNYSCALAADGTAYCWGSHSEGNEVCLNGPCSRTPVPVAGALRFVSIDVGGWYVCGLTAGGKVYCWSSYDATPVPIGGELTFSTLTIGWSHACALTSGGVPYCWGSNFYWQLGTGDTVTSEWTARPVAAGGLRFSALSAGEGHTCGITSTGSAYCWGKAPYWSSTGSSTPRPVMAGLSFASISAGAYSTCGLDAAGTTHCWTDEASETKTLWPAFTKLDSGVGHHCAVTGTGVGYCWGENWAGQLGDGSHRDSPNPVKVAGQP